MTDQAVIYKNKGNEAFSAGRFEEAIDYFTKAIDLNPSDHVFYSNRSGAYANLGKYDDALADAEICISLKPDWIKGYQRQGLAQYYLGLYNQAEDTYNQGLKLDPNNQQLKEGLARVLEKKPKKTTTTTTNNANGGTTGGAGVDVNTLLQTLLSNPKTAGYFQDPEFIRKLTEIQKNPQNYMAYLNDPKIKDAFEVLLQSGAFGNYKPPEDHTQTNGNSSYQGHGSGYSTESSKPQQTKTEENSNSNSASGSTSKATTSSTTSTTMTQSVIDAESEKNKGNEEYRKKNFEKAIQHYDKAFELDPNEYIYLNNKAAALLELKRYDECEKVLDQAVEVAKKVTYDFAKIAKVYARKGSLYIHLEDYDNAIEWYKKSLLEDKNDKVKDELKRLEKLKKELDTKKYINPQKAEEHRLKGNEYFQSGKFPEAIKEYEEGIRRNPNDAKLYANRATAYLKLMEYPHALQDIDKSISLDPNYIKAYAKKGTIHHAMKEYHKAMEAFEKGLKIDPENVECKEGLRKTKEAILMGNYSESKEEQQERLRHAMADPEIQSILQDPQIHALLQDMQKNPHDLQVLKAFSDPTIESKIEKLMAAGILRTG